MKKSVSTEPTKATINAILNILSETPQKLNLFANSLSAEAAQVPLGEGERSFHEDLAHILNVEAISSQSIYLALMLREPLLHPVHAERDWGKLLRYDLLEIPDLLAYFKFRRVVLLRVLNSLSDAQWLLVVREENKARKESIYWRARGLAMHELEHLTDLEKKLTQG
jgi:hypothetical protein